MPKKSSLRLPKAVHLIECHAGDNPNQLPLFWGERPVIVDTGLKDEPESIIVPTLRSLSRNPAQIAVIVNSHADVDHNGGNASMLRHCPQARLACGEADQAMIESEQALWDLRWNQLAAEHAIAYPDSLRNELGPGTRVDWILRDGDVLDLGHDRSLQVIATPGHSFGHLSFLLRPERMLFVGDSVQGVGRQPFGFAGSPQYMDPDVYLHTLRRIGSLRPRWLLTCHFGAFRGTEIRALLDASRQFVIQLDGLVRRALRTHRAGLTVTELTYQASRALGLWEEPDDINFTATVHGHLARAVRRGRARLVGQERPLRYAGD